MNNMPNDDVWIRTACFMCTNGPDLLEVHRVNGVAVDVRGVTEGPMASISGGRLCSKPHGLIQKLYNPYRIKAPMKRTNPEKGEGVDPKWVEISWDEALDTIAGRLKGIRERNSRLLAASWHTPSQLAMEGTWFAFLKAWGPSECFHAGHSIRCGLVQHSFANYIHGAFRVWADIDHCNYLLLLGSNPSASRGVMTNMLYQKSHDRGMKVVAVDPVLSVTAMHADEWIPIKPDTDGAFLLALIHVIIHELGKYDEPFLKEMTNSPYLVGPDGYFMRDRETGKVLVWDAIDQKAKAYDDPGIKDFSLEGTYTVQGLECCPSFQVLKEHVSGYTPEWAAPITDIPAETIRRIAGEFVDNARIGATITLDGISFPHRPVGVQVGRPVEASRHSYQNILAQHILAGLVGGIEVPGSTGGGYTSPSHLSFGLNPGPDGMLEVGNRRCVWPPVSYDFMETLFPLLSWWPGRVAHLSYLNLTNPPPGFPLPDPPEVYIRWRDNPIKSIGDPKLIMEAILKVPFIVSIAYVRDEITELADIVLPDHTEFERFEPLDIMLACETTKMFEGFVLRQPVVEPVCNTMDISDISTELAARAGFLDEDNEAVNQIVGLVDKYQLEPGRKYSWEEIVDRRCRSVTDGERGLADFSEDNAMVAPTSAALEFAFHLQVKANKLRYPIPYMEQVKKSGEELSKMLSEAEIDWWPAHEYAPLPVYLPSVLDEVPAEYDLYATTCRIAQFTQANDLDIPMAVELTNHVPGMADIWIHPAAAKARGIKDGEEVWVESEVGRIKRAANVTEGIRPDTILIAGQLDSKATPISKSTGFVSLNSLIPIRVDWTDPVGGTMQGNVIKVKVYPARRDKNR